jgi:hypothetical protein
MDVGKEQAVIAAGAYPIFAVRADNAAKTAIGEITLLAAAVGIRKENLIFIGPRRHHEPGNYTVRLHDGRGHGDKNINEKYTFINLFYCWFNEIFNSDEVGLDFLIFFWKMRNKKIQLIL